MAINTTLAGLSQSAASNGPDGGADAPSALDDGIRYALSFIAQLRDGKGLAAEVDVASGSTCDIGAANSLLVRITGTTTITSFGTNYSGPRFIRFGGALTLTHNGSTLILPGGASITTAAGDTCVAIPISGGWVVTQYQRAVSFPDVPAGTVIHVAMSSAPTGYLKANGAAVSRTTYARLFAAIGTTFGAGDGSTTFTLPDLRGEFIRGLDDGRGVDTGRVLGSAQGQAIQSHAHETNDSGGTGAVNFGTGGAGLPRNSTAVAGGTTSGQMTNVSGGTETRPRNVALLACIKF